MAKLEVRSIDCGKCRALAAHSDTKKYIEIKILVQSCPHIKKSAIQCEETYLKLSQDPASTKTPNGIHHCCLHHQHHENPLEAQLHYEGTFSARSKVSTQTVKRPSNYKTSYEEKANRSLQNSPAEIRNVWKSLRLQDEDRE